MVRDSGHMVPMDQPEIALDMIDSFIAGKLIGGDPPAPGACANCAPWRRATTGASAATGAPARPRSASGKRVDRRANTGPCSSPPWSPTLRGVPGDSGAWVKSVVSM